MPSDPSSNQTASLSRRSFGKLILGLLSAVAAFEIGGISLAYLKSRGDQNQEGGMLLAGEVEQFAPGSVTAFENQGFFLIRDESGDFLAVDRNLAEVNAEDLLAVMSKGAYGFVMSSNYCSRPRVAEVMVKNDQFHVVKERETYQDLVKGESIPSFMA